MYRIKINIEDEQAIGFSVEKKPENSDDWINLLEELVKSLKAPIVEDKEVI